MTNMHSSLLEMSGIVKHFGGLTAVAGVDLELERGEVLAIVGDNGAGKSTLIKILTGVFAPDEGEIRMEGVPVRIGNRRDARALGIEAVYQSLALVDALDAAGNVFLGHELWRSFIGISLLDNARMAAEATRVLKENVGIELDNLSEPTIHLSGGQRQAVAIARAIYHADLKVLVMDEPTASLGPEETRNTLALIRGLKEQGMALIVISHNLDHVFAIADRVMVMRNGRCSGIRSTAEATKRDVLGLIVSEEGAAAA